MQACGGGVRSGVTRSERKMCDTVCAGKDNYMEDINIRRWKRASTGHSIIYFFLWLRRTSVSLRLHTPSHSITNAYGTPIASVHRYTVLRERKKRGMERGGEDAWDSGSLRSVRRYKTPRSSGRPDQTPCTSRLRGIINPRRHCFIPIHHPPPKNTLRGC